MAYDTCNKKDRTSATFVLDFGSAAANVKSVDAELWMDGDQLSSFHQVALDGGAIGSAHFKQALPARDGELHIAIGLAGGERHVVRHLPADHDAMITIPPERDAP